MNAFGETETSRRTVVVSYHQTSSAGLSITSLLKLLTSTKDFSPVKKKKKKRTRWSCGTRTSDSPPLPKTAPKFPGHPFKISFCTDNYKLHKWFIHVPASLIDSLTEAVETNSFRLNHLKRFPRQPGQKKIPNYNYLPRISLHPPPPR